VVIISLAVLFFLLTVGELTGNSTLTLIAGYEGIFTGLSAVYVGFATVINETYNRDVLSSINSIKIYLNSLSTPKSSHLNKELIQ
jgi:succinate-acetate transporter protein